MARRVRTSFLVLILVALPALVYAIQTMRYAPFMEVKRDGEYKEGDYIPLFVGKAYPNEGDDPCEAYSYFDLPFCPPGDPIPNRKKSFEEVIAGDCYVNTGYELRFMTETKKRPLCEKILTREEVAKVKEAIENKTVYGMYFDNIRFKMQVGEKSATSYDPMHYVFNHLDFHILYLENKVKYIYVIDDYDIAEDISKDKEIHVNFTYSVSWEDFEYIELYLNQQISILSSVSDSSEKVGGDDPMPYTTNIVICAWLLLLCIVIVTYHRKYFTRRNAFQAEMMTKATGLVLPSRIHGYRCRCPPYSSLLGAILGVGTQLFIIVCILFVLAVYTGRQYPCNHESLYTWIITSYVLTSLVSGYKAASFHSSFTRSRWRECVLQTGALYFVPVFITGLAIITLKVITTGVSLPHDWYNYLWKIISLPLSFGILILGGILGQSSLRESEITCSTVHFQSEIRNQAWYMKTPAHMFFGGLLPFCMIFFMMNDIYASLYSLKVCGAFSTMFTAFLLVIILTVSVGMGCTHYQLSNQDNQWWWRSVFRGGSIAIFMFVYGLYFYARASARISMNLLQFLGYNACIFYAVFLILGTIGFYASSIISKRVHRGLKEL
ncbi:transmembrane 9 superfamily member 4-like isoform X2 [Quercus lobata]|uniref:Transmembrane 9 superfamily member n=1 Tax=Quercus lobata TaxID=97700 RepID=A0A7N2R823_QUELO|nr:transmembrane 9 superfamily member 4-like isoform X2 [Quercus lobata]